MATTARPRFTQPNETRAKPLFAGMVGDGRSLAKQTTTMTLAQTPGMNAQGDNSTPVEQYRQPNPGNQVQFAPGDPLRPIPGMGDRQGFPRAFPFPVGGNIQPQPRATETTSFETLRNLAAFYEGIQICEQVHFRILSRLDLAFVPRAEVLESGDNASDSKWVDGGRRIAEWFESPDKRQDLRSWMIAAYRDILEIDALGIFHRQNRGGGLYSLDLLAGDYISCLADGAGRTPLPDAPAYMQVLYGVPAQLFTADELDYLRETARTDSLYGLSRVERILMKVNLALRKGHFDLTRFTDGVTPSGVLETQNSTLFSLTADEVQLWQDMFNGALAGNDALRVRTKAVPPGWTFKALQNEQITTDLDRWLLNITTGVFGLSMDEIGMTETSNRAVGDAQEKVIYRNAVRPTADFFARYFSRILRRYDGLPIDPKNATVSRAASPTRPKSGVWDARYMAMWRGMDEPEDFYSKVDVGIKLFQSGVFTKLQTRHWLQLPVEPGEQDVPAFITPQGGMDQVVVLDDIEDARVLAAKARQQKIDQSDAALRQQQMIDQQMQQQQAQGGQDQGDEDEQDNGEGDESPPEPPSAPSPPSRGGAFQATPSPSKEKTPAPAPDESEDESTGGEDKGDEELPPDEQAQAEVDRLIAEAKKRQQSKQQRMQAIEIDEDDDDADRDFSASRGVAFEPRDSDGGAEWDFPGRGSDAVGTADYRDSTATDGEHTCGDRGGSNPRRGDASSRSVVAERATSRVITSERARDDSRTVSRDDISDEWRRWRTIALKAVRRGEPMPDYVSRVLPANLHAYAAEALQRAVTADDVRRVFSDVREAETHPEECRCMVCGCGEPYNDHGKPYFTLLPQSNATSAGCMVAFFLPATAAQQVMVPGGILPQDLHITLAMLTKDINQVSIDKPRLLECVKQWAVTQQPITVWLDHLDTFPVGKNGVPVVVRTETPALMTLRASLVAALDGAGIAIDQAFPEYKPHVTLMHIQPDVDVSADIAIAALSTPVVETTLSQVWVAYGDERYAFPLGGDDGERAAVVDELRSLRAEVLRAIEVETACAMRPTAMRLVEITEKRMACLKTDELEESTDGTAN